MNTLKKLSIGMVFGVLALGSASASAEGLSVSLPDLGALTAEVSKAIASEVAAQLRNALKAPRATRVRQAPSVTVIETETVVVEASRLPSLDGSEDGVVRTAQTQTSVRF